MNARGLITAAALATSASHAGEPPREVRDEAGIGARVYLEHCATCHGATGEGAPDWKRPNAQGELPAPPHGPDGHTWRHANSMLRRMITEGWRDPFNKTSRLTMPAFKDVLNASEIDAVTDYLTTFWTPEQRRFQSNESRPGP